MSKRVIRITGDLADKVRSLLGGANPTPKRVDALLAELEARRQPREEPAMPLDQEDLDKGRQIFRAGELAERLNAEDPENLEAARANLAEARGRQTHEARERLADRIAANEARGLHRNAPSIEEAPVDTEAPPPTPPVSAQTETTAANQALPDDDAAAVDAAKAALLPKTKGVAETLERRALQKMPQLVSKGRSLKTLEEAASVLIAELEPNHQDALYQVAYEHSLPAWVVILGAIARMADLQELNAGEFDERWMNREHSRVGTAVAPKVEVCGLCGHVIPGARKSQQFCCNKHGSGQVPHSDGCTLSHVVMVKGQWVVQAKVDA